MKVVLYLGVFYITVLALLLKRYTMLPHRKALHYWILCECRFILFLSSVASLLHVCSSALPSIKQTHRPPDLYYIHDTERQDPT